MTINKQGGLIDFWRECRVVYHTAMRNRAIKRRRLGRWMYHRARLTLLERVRNPAMAKAFKEAGFAV